MCQRAPPVRSVMVRMIEPRRPRIVLVFIIVLVRVDVLVLVADEHNRPIDVHVVVTMPQRMQPRQHGQRRAERAEHESSRGSPAMHLRPPV